MGVWRSLSIAVEAVLIIVVFSLVLGVVLGQPILLSFVETGSMEPALNPGDGFVAIPAAVAGPVEEGDVVVYEAEEIQGGGLTTHRVVGETDQGFVTRGMPTRSPTRTATNRRSSAPRSSPSSGSPAAQCSPSPALGRS